MHMPRHAAEPSILEAKPQEWTSLLWQRLAPERWPIPIDALPPGTALVGGAIRDGLLGRLRRRPDLDLVVPENAVKLTAQLAHRHGGACVVLDAQRDMARLVLSGWTLDLARRDGANLETDLWRRDFRLNAIALQLTPSPRLLDPTGGINDLRAGQLTAICEENLIDDPLRLLRGLRLISELHLKIEADTMMMLKRQRHLLPRAAPERIQAELQRLVEGPDADLALDTLQALQLLQPWQHDEDPASEQWADPLCVRGSALESVAAALSPQERQQALSLLRLTGCLGDRGLRELRFSKRLCQRCARLRHWLGRQDETGLERLAEPERLQLHQELEDDLPALILQLPEPQRTDWLERWRDSNDPLFHPHPPVDGRTLQRELDLSAGPRLGQLLDHLCRERAFGRIHNRDESLAAGRQWLMTQCG
jgi:tRNA nucleotidyltransferase (CCA-adding enzyme)